MQRINILNVEHIQGSFLYIYTDEFAGDSKSYSAARGVYTDVVEKGGEVERGRWRWREREKSDSERVKLNNIN